LLRRREWAFLAQFPVRVTTHSLHPRAWDAQAKVVRLVLAVRVDQVVPVVLVAVQVLVAVAVSVVEPPVPSVRAALAVRPRRESQSAPNARNTNKELHRA